MGGNASKGKENRAKFVQPAPFFCASCQKIFDTKQKMNLNCNHGVCASCILAVATNGINEQNLSKLKCPALPDPCQVPLNKGMLKTVLSPSLFIKYEQLIVEESKSLQQSCPKCCGIAEAEPERFYGQCTNKECNFVFCTKCRTEYHGFNCKADEEENDDEDTNAMYSYLLEILDQIEYEPGPSLSANGAAEQTVAPLTFACNICMTDRNMDEAIEFDCGHATSCSECVKGFFESLIKEGNVHGLKCPETECKVKASQKIVRDVVHPDMFTKFDELLLKEALSDFPEIVNCPKPDCQRRVTAEQEYGYCTFCDFRFCTECNQPFHGVTQCGLSDKERKDEIKRYIKADEDERKRLELKAAGVRKKQDTDSENVIRQLYRKCPSCRADIEKIIGCNRMHCKCGKYFCWLCTMEITTADPYDHFRVAGSKCALFEVPSE